MKTISESKAVPNGIDSRYDWRVWGFDVVAVFCSVLIEDENSGL